MNDFLKKMFSESDNSTPCPVRIGSGVTAFIYHIAAVIGVWLGVIHLDMASMGMYLQHMVTLIGTTGASVGVKSVLKGDAQ